MDSIKKGFCQCGCGQKTNIAPCTSKRRGWIKGQPVRYIHNHHPTNSIRTRNGHGFTWKGGRYKTADGYWMIYSPDHLRAQADHVLEHILKAEAILHKPLPPGVVIHHPLDRGNNDIFVICENQSYHNLLHVRTRAFKATGNANYRKCYVCKQWDLPQNFVGYARKDCLHPQCHAEYQRRRRTRIKLSHQTALPTTSQRPISEL